MFILDKPFVSKVLLDTVKRNNYPVLDNDTARELLGDSGNLLSSERFADRFRSRPVVYTNSENAVAWINENLMFSDIVEKVDLFKNKVKFRDLLSGMFPDFFYREVLFNEIETLRSKDLRFPFVIKPAVGFFSLGVYYVEDETAWRRIRPQIIEETLKVRDYYPDDVLNAHSFIIEEVIEGTEYAIDGYYNSDGEPVILNVLKHFFAGSEDVSDRVYVTSVKIVREISEQVHKFLVSLGRLAVVKDFPFHIEVRIDDKGRVVPVELNPLRFAGWCCTDIGFFAYGLNTYEYFAGSSVPDWDEIESRCGDKVYAMVVVEKSAKIDDGKLVGFDYEKLRNSFTKVLELRESDFRSYNVFSFVFAETDSEDAPELKAILNSDLSEYLIY
ncbi:ATP-grasp domain-containing protein [Seleniivibrio woodruffii]|uniref:ATP-grasp domain-containing protein n=1 Tax=Seleniivibrio woodruffii TaxID=1078050 RepID=UPI0039E5D976